MISPIYTKYRGYPLVTRTVVFCKSGGSLLFEFGCQAYWRPVVGDGGRRKIFSGLCQRRLADSTEWTEQPPELTPRSGQKTVVFSDFWGVASFRGWLQEPLLAGGRRRKLVKIFRRLLSTVDGHRTEQLSELTSRSGQKTVVFLTFGGSLLFGVGCPTDSWPAAADGGQ